MKGLDKRLDPILRKLGTSAFEVMDKQVSVIARKYKLDVIHLDDLMIQRQGYDIEEHGSLKDFIISKVGEENTKIIEQAF